MGDDLLSLRLSVVEELRAYLSLEGVAEKETERDWGVQGNELLVGAEGWENRWTLLGKALAEALAVKTEADFYENLLRCNTDAEREAKLLSKGVTKGETGRLVRLFRQEQEPEIEPEVPLEPKAEPPVILIPEPEAESETTLAPVLETDDVEGEETLLETHVPREEDTESRPPLVLKDPETTEILFLDDAGERTGIWRKDYTPRDPTIPTETEQLTQEQKNEIETCGRAAAARKLTEMGYSVTQMPQKHRGFDIRATKNGAELRVEVKAHRRTASVVEITKGEVEECSRHQDRESVRWELWNIENLSTTVSSPIAITRYNQIPDEALRERLLTLDLRKCTPISS